MKIIEVYINDVKKELYNLVPADDFLSELKNNLLDFIKDNPDSSMDDLVEQFGKPEELAKEFLDNTSVCSPKAIAEKNSKKRVLIIILGILLAGVIAYSIMLSMQTQSKATDVMIIYEKQSADD